MEIIGLDLHKRESQQAIKAEDGTITDRRIVTSRIALSHSRNEPPQFLRWHCRIAASRPAAIQFLLEPWPRAGVSSCGRRPLSTHSGPLRVTAFRCLCRQHRRPVRAGSPGSCAAVARML